MEKPKKNFKIKLTLGDVRLEGKGYTMLEAIQAIEPPIKIFTKCFIEVTNGKSVWSETWSPLKTRVLFRKLAQPIKAKQFEYLLKC